MADKLISVKVVFHPPPEATCAKLPTRDNGPSGVKVSVVLTDPFNAAVIRTDRVCENTGVVVVWAVKVVLVVPTGIVTVDGTVTCGSLLVRLTTAPPDGAGPLKFAVHVLGAGGVSGFGVQLKGETTLICVVCGFTVSV